MTRQRFFLAGLLAVLLTGAGLSAAQAQGDTPSAVAPTPAKQAALAVVRLILPSVDLQVELSRRTFEKASAGEDVAAVNASYPGLITALWAHLEPEFRSLALDNNRHLEERLSEFFMQQLTLAEIEAFRRFYATPTGQKIIGRMHVSSNFDAVVADAATGEGQISAETLNVARTKGMAAARSAIGPEDQPALIELGRSVSPAKATAVAAEARKLTEELINRPDPQFEEKVGKMAEVFVSKYMEDHSPRN